jgi:bifunctional ADP-heptose synthase (sugar kinase/adenylyltransferase)
VELSRLDSKNWTPTPPSLEEQIIGSLRTLTAEVDAIILMDQVDEPETGVVTSRLLEAVRVLTRLRPELFIIADSRRSLRGYPPVSLKMNAAELAAMTATDVATDIERTQATAADLARKQGQPVFVTLSERGMIGATPDGEVARVEALPLRGEIDIVGAGDAVTANLCSALAAGAGMAEALEIANLAASIVIHQLGTTGTASVPQIARLLGPSH